MVLLRAQRNAFKIGPITHTKYLQDFEALSLLFEDTRHVQDDIPVGLSFLVAGNLLVLGTEHVNSIMAGARLLVGMDLQVIQ